MQIKTLSKLNVGIITFLLIIFNLPWVVRTNAVLLGLPIWAWWMLIVVMH